MNIELYLVSAFEEYADKNACRKHWNFQWAGRRKRDDSINVCRKHWNFQWRGRRKSQEQNCDVRIRPESFGGLMQSSDGKLWKLDHEAYFWMNTLFGENT